MSLQGPPSALAIVALSTPAPVVLTPLGDLALDPGSLAIVGRGTIPGSGILTFGIPVPNVPIDGTPVVLQGLTHTPGGLFLGAPATVVLH